MSIGPPDGQNIVTRPSSAVPGMLPSAGAANSTSFPNPLATPHSIAWDISELSEMAAAEFSDVVGKLFGFTCVSMVGFVDLKTHCSASPAGPPARAVTSGLVFEACPADKKYEAGFGAGAMFSS